MTRQFIERQFIETTVHRNLTKQQFIERQFIERQFIEYYKTKYQTDSKCTHAKSLSNFIKPNNIVLYAHTQLFYRIFLHPLSSAF